MRLSGQRSIALGGYALGLLSLLIGLPDDGRTGPVGPWLAALLLPTAVIVVDRLLFDLSHRSVGAAAAASVHDAVMLRVAALVIGVHAMTLAGLLGHLCGRPWAARIVPFMLGLAFIGIGNLLPRTRPNCAIGLRTRRTLHDPVLWARTHRRIGYIVVTSGCALLLSAMTVRVPFGPAMILVVGPVAATLIALVAWRTRRPIHV
jgi:hypothetical protein